MRSVRVPLLLLCFNFFAAGQWLNYPAPGLPRTKDGKVDLHAKTPRTLDGKPDLSGVWHVYSEPPEEKQRLFGPDLDQLAVPGMDSTTISKYATDILIDFPPGEIRMTSEGEAIARATREAVGKENRCLPRGIIRGALVSEVNKIIQTPSLIVIFQEGDSMMRQIYTDGRKLPIDPQPSWMGYSTGHWEKDTLVVETAGFNGRTSLDARRHPISDAMRVTERFRRRDVGHLDVEMTFDDPKSYNKPFTIKVTHLLQPDTDILEYVCLENEKDSVHTQ